MLCLALCAVAAAPRWSIALTGDLMFNQIPIAVRSLDAVAPEIRLASIALANLESPLTTVRSRTKRKTASELKARSQFVLAGDPRHVRDISFAHIAMVSLANNHAMDHGAGGIAEMTNALDAASIAHAGAGPNLDEARRVAIVTLLDGYRVGVISALAFNGSGALWKCSPATADAGGVMTLPFNGTPDRVFIRRWIREAKSHCDFLIVALHGGIERHPLPSPYQVALSRAFAEEGANLIWGNHPHVLVGAELYKGVPILYSCGNLVSATPAETAIFRLAFEGKRFLHMAVIPCRVTAGRTSPIKAPRAELRRFRGLETLLHRKFPNPYSAPIPFASPRSPSNRPK